jgi:hypothetical protein
LSSLRPVTTVPSVHVDPALAKKIGSLEDLQEIASLIREWKVIDDLGQIATQDHWFFGRDKPNNSCAATGSVLRSTSTCDHSTLWPAPRGTSKPTMRV